MKKNMSALSILMGGVLWGFIGLFTRHLSDGGLTSVSIVVVRNFGGFLLLALLCLLYDRSLFHIHLRHVPYFIGTGVASVLMFTLCYFYCQQICSLATAAVLLYTAPAFVVLLSALLWKEKITCRKLCALALAFFGSACVSGVFGGGLAVTPFGLLLGIAGGFFYSLYSIFGRYALDSYRPLTVTLYTFLFAGIGSLFLLHPAELRAALSHGGMLWWVLGLVAVATVLPYICYTTGLAGVESGRASILASVEPVTAALVGVVAFGEPMGLPVVLGLGGILTTVYLLR